MRLLAAVIGITLLAACTTPSGSGVETIDPPPPIPVEILPDTNYPTWVAGDSRCADYWGRGRRWSELMDIDVRNICVGGATITGIYNAITQTAVNHGYPRRIFLFGGINNWNQGGSLDAALTQQAWITDWAEARGTELIWSTEPYAAGQFAHLNDEIGTWNHLLRLGGAETCGDLLGNPNTFAPDGVHQDELGDAILAGCTEDALS